VRLTSRQKQHRTKPGQNASENQRKFHLIGNPRRDSSPSRDRALLRRSDGTLMAATAALWYHDVARCGIVSASAQLHRPAAPTPAATAKLSRPDEILIRNAGRSRRVAECPRIAETLGLHRMPPSVVRDAHAMLFRDVMLRARRLARGVLRSHRRRG
jgi:hypothetical protein